MLRVLWWHRFEQKPMPPELAANVVHNMTVAMVPSGISALGLLFVLDQTEEG